MLTIIGDNGGSGQIGGRIDLVSKTDGVVKRGEEGRLVKVSVRK